MRLHNRQIKAGFWNDGDLLEWPMAKRMFYLGLIQLSDDSGCLEDRPRAMRHEIFQSAHDEYITVEQIAQWVQELIDEQKVIRYTVGRKTCLFLFNFHKHQTLRTPSPPDTPLPPWITWEVYPSNSRTGKYIVNHDVLTECLQGSYDGLTMFFQPELEHEPEHEENTKNNGASAPSPSKSVKTRLRELNAGGDVITRLGDAFGEGTGCTVAMIGKSTRSKWAPALIEMHDMGITPEDVKGCLAWLFSESWWKGKDISPAKLLEILPKWIGQGKPATKEQANAPPPEEIGPLLRQRMEHEARMTEQANVRRGTSTS